MSVRKQVEQIKAKFETQVIAKAQPHWDNLNTREQRLVKVFGAVAAIALVYFVVWAPLNQAVNDAQTRVASQQQLLSWVQANTARYEQLAGGAEQAQANSEGDIRGSLTQKFNRVASNEGIQVARTQPQGDDIIAVIDQASFDQVLRLVNNLQTQANVRVVQLDIADAGAPGQVRVRRIRIAN